MADTKKPNRNGCVQWAITMPHSGDICDSKFHEYFPPSVYSICAKEQHVNGEPHLHLGLKLKKPITEANLRKYIIAKFPDDYKRIDYGRIQSAEKWADYLAKEVPPFERGSRTKQKTPVEKMARLLEKNPELWAELGNRSAVEIYQEGQEKETAREAVRIITENRKREYDERLLQFQMNRLNAM